MNDSATSADESIKKIVAKSFAQAGAWALMTLILITGVGYQINWFIVRYVDATTAMMDSLVKTAEKQAEANAANRQFIERAVQTTEKVVVLMENAEKTMHAVPEERQKQTELLEQILEELEKKP